MKDPNLAIRTAYVASLEGAITLSENEVPVFDRVPENSPYPYIWIADQTCVEGPRGKTCLVHDTTITLNVVTGFSGKNAGTKKDCDLISEQIFAVLLPDGDTYPDLGQDFQIVDSTLELSATSQEQEKSQYIIRRIIRLRNIIEQL